MNSRTPLLDRIEARRQPKPDPRIPEWLRRKNERGLPAKELVA